MSQTTRNTGAGIGDSAAAQPTQDDREASILGPRNLPVEAENPDLLASPYTDTKQEPAES